MQFTIEARELTGEITRGPRISISGPRTVEAADANEAISKFVQQSDSELMSLSRVDRHAESIATVKRDDTLFLLRVYAG